MTHKHKGKQVRVGRDGSEHRPGHVTSMGQGARAVQGAVGTETMRVKVGRWEGHIYFLLPKPTLKTPRPPAVE